ncbi:hypothetical protein PVAG01_07830 [Phlyctema vagabunda]|uniref:Uncharacterized protein n=1 Tax=Phlyctema vagabunda TaxID=108571 RepID=A0ABR4PDN6_9HELO
MAASPKHAPIVGATQSSQANATRSCSLEARSAAPSGGGCGVYCQCIPGDVDITPSKVTSITTISGHVGTVVYEALTLAEYSGLKASTTVTITDLVATSTDSNTDMETFVAVVVSRGGLQFGAAVAIAAIQPPSTLPDGGEEDNEGSERGLRRLRNCDGDSFARCQADIYHSCACLWLGTNGKDVDIENGDPDPITPDQLSSLVAAVFTTAWGAMSSSVPGLLDDHAVVSCPYASYTPTTSLNTGAASVTFLPVTNCYCNCGPAITPQYWGTISDHSTTS